MCGVCNKRTVGAADSRPLLFTDLDNTLIYSYKREIGYGKVAVEAYQGRIISYMTGYSHEMMMRIWEKIVVVPVTTRSLSQYNRITFSGIPEVDDARFEYALRPQFALVSNGGNLLIDGEPDERWRQESLELILPSLEQLAEAERILAKDSDRCFEIRRVDDFFIFTKSERPEKTCRYLSSMLDAQLVFVRQNGNKVYVIPRLLEKGTAVRRFLTRFESYIGSVFCAGDSDFDVSFLLLGNRVFCPVSLQNNFSQKKIICAGEKDILSDLMFNYLQNTIK